MLDSISGAFNCSVFGILVLSTALGNGTAFAAGGDAESIQGKWWIIGSTTRGVLELKIDVNNHVEGLIYQQPIRGTWNGENRELSFVRYVDEQATQPMQRWSGKVIEIACNSRNVLVLEGTFRTLNEGAEAEKKEYKWSGQSVHDPAPSLDLQQLQGDWEVSHVTRCSKPSVKLPDEIGLNASGVGFTIRGNQIQVGDRVTATFANDLQSGTLAGQVGFLGSRIMVISTPSGQGLICSYFIENEVVEIAYPHTTSCHRGSGHIIKLVRKHEGSKTKE